MNTYTVKTGDTKSSLKKKYGIAFNDTQYRSTDPNKLFAGETLNIPTQGPKQPVYNHPVQGSTVDLSKITEGKKPVPDEVLPERDPVETPKFASTDNEITNSKVANGELPTSQREDQPQDPRIALNEEIETLGREIARKEESRTSAYEDNGIFDDVRRLNDLKGQLRTAEDKQIEIPIEERQKLRGTGATKTEFNQGTRPKLEDAALESLAASRSASGLSDIISTNMQIVDQRLASEFAEKEFDLERKISTLDKLDKLHADIMSNEQKAALEAQKFRQQIALESFKIDGTLKGDLLKELIKQGVGGPELEGLASGSLNDILTFSSERQSPTQWSELTSEEAAMTLGKDEYKKYESYREWEKDKSDEEKANVTQALAAQSGAVSTISIIEKMLANTGGLSDSVGIALGNVNFWPDADTAKFRSQFKQLVSANTLNTLKELKATGATMGALNKSELDILINAEQALGTVMNGENITGRSNLGEADFTEALKTMRVASMKTYIAASIGKEAYSRAGYIDADFDTISKRYNELKDRPAQDYSNEVDDQGNLSRASQVIQGEEGFRSEAYQDSTGTWTIGYGTTNLNGRPVQPGDSIDSNQAQGIMAQQIVDNYTTFTDKVSGDLTPNQFAALTSFEYNLGPGIWNNASGQAILSAINSGDFTKAGQLMLAYNKSREDGVLTVNPVLTARRKREANLLLT